MINLEKLPKIQGIYKLVNTVNNKIYIGKSNNIHRRITSHKYSYHKNVICRAIKKYGWDNFSIEIIEEFDNIDNLELLALETAYIEYYDSINMNIGYNVCLFSNDHTGLKRSQDYKLKLSSRMKGRINKPMSEETKSKISKARTGLKATEETKQKQRIGHEKYKKSYKIGEHFNNGKKHTKETIDKKNQKLYKPIKQININTGEVIKIWISATMAMQELKIHKSRIGRCCKGKRKTTGGFKWEYAKKEN